MVRQLIERLAAVLWDPQALDPYEVHRQVDRRLARPLDVEHDRILLGDVLRMKQSGKLFFLHSEQRKYFCVWCPSAVVFYFIPVVAKQI